MEVHVDCPDRAGGLSDGLQLRHVYRVGVLRAGGYAGDLTVERRRPCFLAAGRPADGDGALRLLGGVPHALVIAHIDRRTVRYGAAVGHAVAAQRHGVGFRADGPYAQRHGSAHFGMIFNSSDGVCPDRYGVVTQRTLIAVILSCAHTAD